jgi:hypothetical protein
MDAVAANVAAHPAVTPLEFMLGIMADPNVDPNLRFKAAQAAAPYCYAKPLVSAPPPGDLVIEAHDDPHSKIERAKVEAIERRIDELDGLERFLEGPPLTRAEQAELADLKTRLANVPAHLKRMPAGFDDPVLREFLEEDVWGRNVARPSPPHEDSTEMHKRPLAERQANAAVKALPCRTRTRRRRSLTEVAVNDSR